MVFRGCVVFGWIRGGCCCEGGIRKLGMGEVWVKIEGKERGMSEWL